jgi:hypothetical protein
MIDPGAARHVVPRLKTGPTPAPLQIAAVRQDIVQVGLPAVPRNHPVPALAVAPRSGAGLTAAPAIPSAPNDGVRSSIISDENQKAIFKFLKSSVQPSTNRKYDVQWGWFEEFMRENWSADPFMRDLTQQEKPFHDKQVHERKEGQSGHSSDSSYPAAFLSRNVGHVVFFSRR